MPSSSLCVGKFIYNDIFGNTFHYVYYIIILFWQN